MITGALTPTASGNRPAGSSRSAHRVLSLARTEALLLRRKPLALLTVTVMPIALVLPFTSCPSRCSGSRT